MTTAYLGSSFAICFYDCRRQKLKYLTVVTEMAYIYASNKIAYNLHKKINVLGKVNKWSCSQSLIHMSFLLLPKSPYFLARRGALTSLCNFMRGSKMMIRKTGPTTRIVLMISIKQSRMLQRLIWLEVIGKTKTIEVFQLS